MPIYEYHCTECDSRFEKITTAGNADSISCEKCTSLQTTRLLSAFGITAGMSSSSECNDPQPPGACDQGYCPCSM